MTAIRQSAARDAAWGRWYAKRGAARAIARTRRGIPQPASAEERLAAYRSALACCGYDHRELARRAANGARMQDSLRAQSVIAGLVAQINPDSAPAQVRSTRENGHQPSLFTAAQVLRG